MSGWAAALPLVLVSFGARADPWQLEAGIGRGTPGGLIQVRENDVQGTALPLGPALGLGYVEHQQFDATDEIDATRAIILRADFARIYGETASTTPVFFNGIELAAGSPLASSASWLNDWQLTALYDQRLTPVGVDLRVDGTIGLTYRGLTYSLQGHPSDASSPAELSGSRTSEDFITQELPVPQLGLNIRYALAAAWTIDADFLGGHLPRLYSLRNEGGKVYVTQTDQEARLGLEDRWGNGLRLDFGWYDSYFMQYEDSAEDGNYIRLTEHGLYLTLGYRFQSE